MEFLVNQLELLLREGTLLPKSMQRGKKKKKRMVSVVNEIRKK